MATKRVKSAYVLCAEGSRAGMAGINCLSLAIQVRGEWTVYSTFLWDNAGEGGQPGLCTINMPNADKEAVFALALSSLRIGGYTTTADGGFEPLADYLHLPELYVEDCGSSEPEILVKLISDDNTYIAKTLGYIIKITKCAS